MPGNSSASRLLPPGMPQVPLHVQASQHGGSPQFRRACALGMDDKLGKPVMNPFVILSEPLQCEAAPGKPPPKPILLSPPLASSACSMAASDDVELFML
jgi:hypothetical protein